MNLPSGIILITDNKNPDDICGTWWRFDRVNALHPKGYGFDSRCSRHVGKLGKSFIHSCLWRFSVKFRHSICAVSGALLSGRGLEEAL